MSYFNKAEKILKSCLKEKLSINTTTVIAFLITGMVSFSMTIDGTEKGNNVKLSTGGEVVSTTKDESLNIDGKEISSKNEINNLISIKATAENSINTIISEGSSLKGENVKGATLKAEGNVKVVNNGKIEKASMGTEAIELISLEKSELNFENNGNVTGGIKVSNIGMGNKLTINNTNGEIDGIYTNYEYEGGKTISINEINIINSSNIATNKEGLKKNHKENNHGKNSAIFFVGNSKDGKINIVNTKVGVIGNKKLSNGIILLGTTNGNINIENSGKIIGNDVALGISSGKIELLNHETGVIEAGHIGVSLNNSPYNNYNIKNFGKIIVNGDADHGDSTGLSLIGKGVAVNEVTGIIEVTANTKSGATGVIVDKGGEFINKGTIKVHRAEIPGEKQADIKGIVVYENATIKNEGTLEIDSFGTNGSKSIAIENKGGIAINNGIIKIADKTAKELEEIGRIPEDFFAGTVTNKGTFVDRDGNYISTKNEIVIDSEKISTDELNSKGKGVESVVIKRENINLEGGKEKVNIGALTVAGAKLNIINNGNEIVEFKDTNINLIKNNNKDAQIKIGTIDNKADLVINNGNLNKAYDSESIDIVFENKDSTLTLIDSSVDVNVGNGNGTVNIFGDSKISGNIQVKELNIGNGIEPLGTSNKENSLKLETTSKILGGAVNISSNGSIELVIGKEGENALKNSSGLVITGDGIDNNGDIKLNVSNMTDKSMSISLGENNSFKDVDITTELGENSIYSIDDSKLSTDGTSESIVTISYNDDLYKDNFEIDGMHRNAYGVGAYLSEDKNIRKEQYDKLYAGNIYSETVKASYDTVKLNENTILSSNINSEVGKWSAIGQGIFNKVEYNREGTLNKEYSSEIETSGLMGIMEYGVNNNTSIGVAFSGAYQNVDTDGGQSDGTILYLGTYAKKNIGNYKFILGLGYQYGDYSSDNTAGSIGTSKSYDVNTLSTFIEGRYTIDMGDSVTFEPKVKLGYTYVDQDDIKDNYFGVSDANLSTFDTEVGIDLVKTYTMKDGKANLVFGASYIKVMGDTDKEFTGEFIGSDGRFDIKGAELTENTGKFSLSIEVLKNNGFFYNGGINLNVGNDNYRNYGLSLGAGYKF